VNVAVVMPELDPRSGGGFIFQRTLYDALRVMEGQTAHRFVYYAGGDPDGAGDSLIRLPLDARDRAARRLLQLGRDAQDRVLGVRPIDRRGAFERSLDERGIELVWFATPYARDCDQPYIFTIWDLEYLNQPWFPEVGRGGEWQQRHQHYSRYVPRATRDTPSPASSPNRALPLPRVAAVSTCRWASSKSLSLAWRPGTWSAPGT